MIEKVLFELVIDGIDDIWTQVRKLSVETCIVPEQLVLEKFVVTEEASIVSENVVDIDEVINIAVSESAGDVELTVGGVVSVVVVLSEVELSVVDVLSVVAELPEEPLSLLHEIRVMLNNVISKL